MKTTIYIIFIIAFLEILAWLIYPNGLASILLSGFFAEYHIDGSGYGAPVLEKIFGVDRGWAIFLNYVITYIYFSILILFMYSTTYLLIKKRKLDKNSPYFNISFITSLLLIFIHITINILGRLYF